MNYEYLFLVQSYGKQNPRVAMYRRLDGEIELFTIEGEDWVEFDPGKYWDKWRQVVNFCEETSIADFAFVVPQFLIGLIAFPPEFKKASVTNWTRDDACQIMRGACGDFCLREKGVTIMNSSVSCTEPFELVRFNVPKGQDAHQERREESSFYEKMRNGELPPSLKEQICHTSTFSTHEFVLDP